MLTSHRTRHRAARWGLATLLLAAFAAALAILAIPSRMMEATGPPPSYTLYTAVSGEGSITPSGGSYSSGTQLQLLATPASGWSFDRWEGEASGSSNPLTVTMDEDRAIVGYFNQDGYALTTSVSPPNSGSVSPSGGIYAPGSEVSLTATPDPGYQFSHWSGDVTGVFNPIAITMDAPTDACAVMLPERKLLIEIVGDGDVAFDVAPVREDAPDEYTFLETQSITIYPFSGSGYIFDRWEESITGSNVPGELTIDSQPMRTVRVVFTPGYKLLRNWEGRGSVTADPAGDAYSPGTPVSLTATPDTDYFFHHWENDLQGTVASQPLTMDADKMVKAYFVYGNETAGQAHLLTQTEGDGIVETAPPGEWHAIGTSVTVRAIPIGMAALDRWEGDLSGNALTQTIVMNDHKTARAIFDYNAEIFIGADGPGKVLDANNVVQAIGEDFNDGDYAGWTVWSGTWSAANGYLEKTTTTSSATLSRAFTHANGEYGFSYRCTDITSPNYCYVRFRYTPADEFIQLVLRPGTISWSKKIAGAWTSLGSAPIETLQDQWYDVKVVMNGPHVEVWRGLRGDVSSLILSTDEAEPLATNWVFLGVYGNSNVHFHVDDIAVNSRRSFDTVEDITLTPVPVPSTSFITWTGDLTDKSSPAVVTTDADKEVTGWFRELFNVFVISKAGDVEVSPAETAHAVPDATGWIYGYAEGSEVELLAVPDPGVRFEQWSRDASGTVNPLRITVDQDMIIEPVFVPDHASTDFVWIQLDYPQFAHWEGEGNFHLSPSPDYVYVENLPPFLPPPGYEFGPAWYRYPKSLTEHVTLSFTPVPGSTWFVREWRYAFGMPPGLSYMSTNPTLDIPLDQEAHITPALGYQLMVNIEGDGAIHFGDPGTTYDTSPVVVDFPESEMVSVYAVPDANAGFVQWLGSATSATNPLSLTMDENKELTAVFSTAFEVGDVNLNVTELGQGEVTVNTVPVTGSERFVFDADTQVILTATPAQGYDFVGWGGHLTGTTTPQTLLLDSSKSVSALFIPTGTTPVPQKEVHVSIQGNGTVTPAGAVKDVDDLYPVEFTALPEYGWRFVRWELNGFDVGDINVLRLTLLDSDHLIAIFEPGYSVVALVDSERGDVFYSSTSPQLAGMFLPWSLGYRLDGSDSVTVRAVPKPGHRFSHWEGAISAATANVTFGVTENMVIEPIFIRVLPFNIFANAHGTVSAKLNSVSVPSNGDSIIWLGDEGSQVELTAAPEYGYHLDRWDGTSVVEISENKAVLTLNDQSEVRAHFARDVVEFSVDVVHPEWGEVLIEPEKNEYYVGDVVQITPIQDEGCTFDGFTAEPGSDNYTVLQNLPLVARLTGDTHLHLKFTKAVVVQTFSDVGGSVEINPTPQYSGMIECVAGTDVTLMAVPSAGFHFLRWEGDITSSQPTLQLDPLEDLVLRAKFASSGFDSILSYSPRDYISLSPQPENSRGFDCCYSSGFCREYGVGTWLAGTIIDVAFDREALATEWNCHPDLLVWQGISGGWWEETARMITGALPDIPSDEWHCDYHSDGRISVQRYPINGYPIFSITVHVRGRGFVTGGMMSGSFIFPPGTPVKFKAGRSYERVGFTLRPDDGWVFSHWEYNEPNVQMLPGGLVVWDWGYWDPDALSTVVTANFEPLSPVRLQIDRVGLGTAKVAGGGIEFSSGDLIVLEAEPADGWTFERWEYGSGALLSIHRRTGFIIQSNTTVRAVFKENPILLTHVEGNGHVLRSPEGVFYPPTPGSPPQDAVVRLDAVQHADSVFVGWSGTGIAYTDASLTNSIPLDNPSNPADDPVIWIVMDPDLESGTRHITANFECACAIGGGGTKSTEGETECECYADVAVKLELEPGGFSIDPTNEYSENTTIRATVVDPNTGDILTGFGGIACIREVETDIYYPRGEMVSAMMNGAQHGFPLSLEFTASDQGTKTFVAKSVAWAVPGEPGGSLYVKPSPSKIKVTNMTDYGTTPLEILQWVDNGPIAPIDGDDPICANAAPDWFETKVRDIFAVATNDVATVFSVVQDYKYELGERSAAGWVEQRRQEFHTIYLNPYTLVDRIDKTPLSNNIYRCLGHSYVADRELRRTITHEARHAYQNNLVSRPGNDDDQDWLPEVVDVAPLNIIVDNPTPRDRCNSGNVTLSGDDTFDCYFAADPHTTPCDESVWVYQNLIEDDAEQFAEDHKDDDR